MPLTASQQCSAIHVFVLKLYDLTFSFLRLPQRLSFTTPAARSNAGDNMPFIVSLIDRIIERIEDVLDR
jgi:hypothetical protein